MILNVIQEQTIQKSGSKTEIHHRYGYLLHFLAFNFRLKHQVPTLHELPMPLWLLKRSSSRLQFLLGEVAEHFHLISETEKWQPRKQNLNVTLLNDYQHLKNRCLPSMQSPFNNLVYCRETSLLGTCYVG